MFYTLDTGKGCMQVGCNLFLKEIFVRFNSIFTKGLFEDILILEKLFKLFCSAD